MQRFVNRVVFVTGGGHGIGRATALRLASEGATVAVADIDMDAAERVSAEISQAGGAAMTVHCDITDASSVDAAMETCVDRFGGLDVVAHTAGGGRHEPSFEEAADDAFVENLDLNYMGSVRVVRAALPHLSRSGFGGNAVLVGSINGQLALGGHAYSEAKAALSILVANLATEYGGQGLRFNVVSPGTVRTRVWDDQQDALERLQRGYPLGRIGEPEDIAAAIAFLASDDAAWVTGVTLPVDGGMMTGPRALLFPEGHDES